MKEYEVEITETLQRKVRVTAETPEDAYFNVRSAYNCGDIVLGSEDFAGVDYSYDATPVHKQRLDRNKGGQGHER
ncbi:DpnD/PcfM family protein [Ruminococcaceae bacterium OttesenSCG-928-A16]|nr:DpnD/PcfM family protein [Ruminococcaceae bacterium OttesenSCG-928-A16]